MNRTCELFKERKSEIEFYYSVLVEIAAPDSTIKTMDNHRFAKILKSNFLLMLYNLIESCVKSGFEDIYSAIKDSGEPYPNVAEELRDIWSNYEISKAHKDTANRQTYGKRVKEIIEQVISNNPLVITRDALDISGNLDARQIRTLLDVHKISFSESVQGDKNNILTVKNKRNALAHGDEAFGEAARELTIDDLVSIKDEVFIFIGDVLHGMTNYYNAKKYLYTPQNRN
jgi:hypothetical protein